MSFAREKLLEEARRVIEAGDGNRKKGVSLVVIGMWIGTSAVVSLPGISLFRSR
jgi:hypothetical protein